MGAIIETLSLRGRCVFGEECERAFAPIVESDPLAARKLMAAQKHTVIAAGITKQAAMAKAKELRAAGKTAYVWPSETKGKRDVVVMEADEEFAAAVALVEADDGFEAGLAVTKKAIRGKLPPSDEWQITRCWSIHDDDDFDAENAAYETCANCGKSIAYCVDLTGPEDVTVGTDCAEALTSGATLATILAFAKDEQKVAREVLKRFKPLLDHQKDMTAETLAKFSDALTTAGGDPLITVMAGGYGMSDAQGDAVAAAMGYDKGRGLRAAQAVAAWLKSQAARANPVAVKSLVRQIVKHGADDSAWRALIKDAWHKALAGHRFEAPKPKVRAADAVDKSVAKVVGMLKALAPSAAERVTVATFLAAVAERWPEGRQKTIAEYLLAMNGGLNGFAKIARFLRLPEADGEIVAKAILGEVYAHLVSRYGEDLDTGIRAALDGGWTAGSKKFWLTIEPESFLRVFGSSASGPIYKGVLGFNNGLPKVGDFVPGKQVEHIDVRIGSLAASRRGILPPLAEQYDLGGINVKAHSTGLSRKTADVIGSKLRKVGFTTFVRPSAKQPDKYDVLVKVEH